MKGPSFIALHELFDTIAADAAAFADAAAERIGLSAPRSRRPSLWWDAASQ